MGITSNSPQKTNNPSYQLKQYKGPYQIQKSQCLNEDIGGVCTVPSRILTIRKEKNKELRNQHLESVLPTLNEKRERMTKS
jgi:hypothetical protein